MKINIKEFHESRFDERRVNQVIGHLDIQIADQMKND